MKTKVFSAIISMMLMTSCATYYATPQSLHSQLSGNKGITQINCVDKDGKEQVLPVTRHTGIRITKKDSTRQTFIVATAYVQDSLIMGSKSDFFNIPIKPIKISEIQKIEFQE